MQVPVLAPFTAQLVDPAGIPRTLGARVEVPVIRSIVSMWQAATLQGSVWTVTLDGPPFVGDYQLVWMTSDSPPSFEAMVPLFATDPSTSTVGVDYPPVDVPSVTPSIDDVAALLRTRTVAGSGTEEITFTDQTRPAADEVSALIPQALDAVLAELPYKTFDPLHYPQVKRVTALMSAILIEGSYFREQLTEGSANLWRTLYTTALSGLQQRMKVDLSQQLLLARMEPPQPWPITAAYPFDTPYPFYVQ
jgi:hypothetical protein